MNVKISYTVPFEEVPTRIQNLLTENRNKLEEAAEVVNLTKISNDNIHNAMKNIDIVRKLLIRIDNQMSDCYNILYGYNKALLDNMQPIQQEEVTDAVNMDNNPTEG